MKKQSISIIIPTYKEAENIPVLAKKLNETLKNYNYEIIIVDDDSNDGTIEAVNKLKKQYKIILKVRKNIKGLSSAVIAGFKISKGDIIVVMDADLSHPPKKVLELVNEISKNNYEFAIGSRFVKGGSIVNFNIYRKLNAWIAKTLARPLFKVQDPMSGFFAFPAKLLKKKVELNPLGFKIGLELLVKLSPNNVSEIPINFQERLHGVSKLSLKEQLLYIRHLIRLYDFKYKSIVQFLKFSIIGTTGMTIDLTLVYVSKEFFALHFRIARIIGFVFALTSNFFLNRKFTFQKKDGNIAFQYIKFFIVAVIAFSVNWFMSVYLYENLAFFNKYYLLAAFMGILCGLTINFFGSKIIVFK